VATSGEFLVAAVNTLDELPARIRRFAADFNEHWLLERHRYRSPRQAPSARHGMIIVFTSQVSGEPGPAHHA